MFDTLYQLQELKYLYILYKDIKFIYTKTIGQKLLVLPIYQSITPKVRKTSKAQVHPKQNAFAFQTKRKYVLSKTQGRFILNVRAF